MIFFYLKIIFVPINFSDEEDNETDNAMNYVETSHNVKQE